MPRSPRGPTQRIVTVKSRLTDALPSPALLRASLPEEEEEESVVPAPSGQAALPCCKWG